MKEYSKYIISAIVFLVVYTLVSYICTKNIDIKMVLLTTVIYTVSYTAIDLACNKKAKKKKNK